MATTTVEEIIEALPHIKKTGARHIWLDLDEYD
jgi:hypothetical protein